MPNNRNRPQMSDQDKKLLWGKAGNRCAICKKFLVNIEDNDDRGVIVGIEAHIVGHSLNGPRGANVLPLSDRHKYENIILLCQEHAKTIDERPEVWPEERLMKIKREHEILMRDINPLIEHPRPVLRLIRPVGYQGGPEGHFQSLRLKNFDTQVALDLKCWITGFGFFQDLSSQTEGAFLEAGDFKDYTFRIDGSKIYHEKTPLLYFNATYSNLEGQKILYKSSLVQKTVPSGSFMVIDLGDTNTYTKNLKTEVDFMIMLDSFGDYKEASYVVDGNKFKIKVSGTLLSCWGYAEGPADLYFLELGRANMKMMSSLGVFQDIDYSTTSFPETSKTGFERFVENLKHIESGSY